MQIVHIPYKGGGQSLTDLLAGQLQMVIDNLPTAGRRYARESCAHLPSGPKTRSALVPEYPTMAEAGVPGYEASTASGLLAPR